MYIYIYIYTGADGFAFVLHEDEKGSRALGKKGGGMGYEGLSNALAVEFDTYYNYENFDSYENHVGVMTTGFRFNINANHTM
jgi:hypothetical protein